ncbi:MAG: hypothetical protein AB1599_03350 [Planctomycetota bacterium]
MKGRLLLDIEDMLATDLGRPKRAPDPVRKEEPPKKYSVAQIRNKHLKAYEKWTKDADERLRKQYLAGKSINALAEIFQRKPGAIRSRLHKLELSR